MNLPFSFPNIPGAGKLKQGGGKSFEAVANGK